VVPNDATSAVISVPNGTVTVISAPLIAANTFALSPGLNAVSNP
jgi:hypothetical protein